jgi:hypothetical protein
MRRFETILYQKLAAFWFHGNTVFRVTLIVVGLNRGQLHPQQAFLAYRIVHDAHGSPRESFLVKMNFLWGHTRSSAGMAPKYNTMRQIPA